MAKEKRGFFALLGNNDRRCPLLLPETLGHGLVGLFPYSRVLWHVRCILTYEYSQPSKGWMPIETERIRCVGTEYTEYGGRSKQRRMSTLRAAYLHAFWWQQYLRYAFHPSLHSYAGFCCRLTGGGAMTTTTWSCNFIFFLLSLSCSAKQKHGTECW